MKASDGQGVVRLKIRNLGPYTHKVQGLPSGIYTPVAEPGSIP